MNLLIQKLVRWINRLTFLEFRRECRRQKRAHKDHDIAKKIIKRHGMHVMKGPFRGMVYPSLAASGSCLTPKLIGSYEKETHSFIEQLIKTSHDRIINIGCGEGFYAVGMALRMPEVHVFAFDENAEARELCNALAMANGVIDRVTVKGKCNQNELAELLAKPAIIICDCEGCETYLLEPDKIEELQSCDILVELHKTENEKDTADIILSRFESTHQTTLREFNKRNSADYSEISFLSGEEQKFAVDENRSRGMQWALLKPGEGLKTKDSF